MREIKIFVAPEERRQMEAYFNAVYEKNHLFSETLW